MLPEFEPSHFFSSSFSHLSSPFFMISSLLFAGLILAVVLVKYLYKPAPRCPECNALREGDHPICVCGYIFEFPDDDDDDDPLEYAESNDPSETR